MVSTSWDQLLEMASLVVSNNTRDAMLKNILHLLKLPEFKYPFFPQFMNIFQQLCAFLMRRDWCEKSRSEPNPNLKLAIGVINTEKCVAQRFLESMSSTIAVKTSCEKRCRRQKCQLDSLAPTLKAPVILDYLARVLFTNCKNHVNFQ